jgi:hypothetical protein
MIPLIIFVGTSLLYIFGRRADYRNSLGRGEQNKEFQNDKGYFDPKKFKREAIGEYAILAIVASILALAIDPWFLVMVVPVFIWRGIQGLMLSTH